MKYSIAYRYHVGYRCEESIYSVLQHLFLANTRCIHRHHYSHYSSIHKSTFYNYSELNTSHTPRRVNPENFGIECGIVQS